MSPANEIPRLLERAGSPRLDNGGLLIDVHLDTAVPIKSPLLRHTSPPSRPLGAGCRDAFKLGGFPRLDSLRLRSHGQVVGAFKSEVRVKVITLRYRKVERATEVEGMMRAPGERGQHQIIPIAYRGA